MSWAWFWFVIALALALFIGLMYARGALDRTKAREVIRSTTTEASAGAHSLQDRFAAFRARHFPPKG